MMCRGIDGDPHSEPPRWLEFMLRACGLPGGFRSTPMGGEMSEGTILIGYWDSDLCNVGRHMILRSAPEIYTLSPLSLLPEFSSFALDHIVWPTSR